MTTLRRISLFLYAPEPTVTASSTSSALTISTNSPFNWASAVRWIVSASSWPIIGDRSDASILWMWVSDPTVGNGNADGLLADHHRG